MAWVTITFDWSNGDSDSEDFESVAGIESLIESHRAIRECELNDAQDASDEPGDPIECDEWYVSDTNLDFCDQLGPDSFDSLESWVDYCDRCDTHGEGYVLRCSDIGDHDFNDSYEGCWGSEEEFVRRRLDDCGDISVPTYVHIDWDSTTRDVMMDYSSYEGSEGCHIFRD